MAEIDTKSVGSLNSSSSADVSVTFARFDALDKALFSFFTTYISKGIQLQKFAIVLISLLMTFQSAFIPLKRNDILHLGIREVNRVIGLYFDPSFYTPSITNLFVFVLIFIVFFISILVMSIFGCTMEKHEKKYPFFIQRIEQIFGLILTTFGMTPIISKLCHPYLCLFHERNFDSEFCENTPLAKTLVILCSIAIPLIICYIWLYRVFVFFPDGLHGNIFSSRHGRTSALVSVILQLDCILGVVLKKLSGLVVSFSHTALLLIAVIIYFVSNPFYARMGNILVCSCLGFSLGAGVASFFLGVFESASASIGAFGAGALFWVVFVLCCGLFSVLCGVLMSKRQSTNWLIKPIYSETKNGTAGKKEELGFILKLGKDVVCQYSSGTMSKNERQSQLSSNLSGKFCGFAGSPSASPGFPRSSSLGQIFPSSFPTASQSNTQLPLLPTLVTNHVGTKQISNSFSSNSQQSASTGSSNIEISIHRHTSSTASGIEASPSSSTDNLLPVVEMSSSSTPVQSTLSSSLPVPVFSFVQISPQPSQQTSSTANSTSSSPFLSSPAIQPVSSSSANASSSGNTSHPTQSLAKSSSSSSSNSNSYSNSNTSSSPPSASMGLNSSASHSGLQQVVPFTSTNPMIKSSASLSSHSRNPSTNSVSSLVSVSPTNCSSPFIQIGERGVKKRFESTEGLSAESAGPLAILSSAHTIKKVLKLFNKPEKIEMSLRFLYNPSIRKLAVYDNLLAFADELYIAALNKERFEQSAELIVSYTLFLDSFKKARKHRSMLRGISVQVGRLLQRACECCPGWTNRWIIYQKMKKMESILGELSMTTGEDYSAGAINKMGYNVGFGGSTSGMLKTVNSMESLDIDEDLSERTGLEEESGKVSGAYMMHIQLQQANKDTELAKAHLIRMWTLLARRVVDVQMVMRHAVESIQNRESAQHVFVTLLEAYPDNANVMRQYALLLRDVFMDEEAATELLHEADSIEEATMTENSAFDTVSLLSMQSFNNDASGTTDRGNVKGDSLNDNWAVKSDVTKQNLGYSDMTEPDTGMKRKEGADFWADALGMVQSAEGSGLSDRETTSQAIQQRGARSQQPERRKKTLLNKKDRKRKKNTSSWRNFSETVNSKQNKSMRIICALTFLYLALMLVLVIFIVSYVQANSMFDDATVSSDNLRKAMRISSEMNNAFGLMELYMFVYTNRSDIGLSMDQLVTELRSTKLSALEAEQESYGQFSGFYKNSYNQERWKQSNNIWLEPSLNSQYVVDSIVDKKLTMISLISWAHDIISEMFSDIDLQSVTLARMESISCAFTFNVPFVLSEKLKSLSADSFVETSKIMSQATMLFVLFLCICVILNICMTFLPLFMLIRHLMRQRKKQLRNLCDCSPEDAQKIVDKLEGKQSNETSDEKDTSKQGSKEEPQPQNAHTNSLKDQNDKSMDRSMRMTKRTDSGFQSYLTIPGAASLDSQGNLSASSRDVISAVSAISAVSMRNDFSLTSQTTNLKQPISPVVYPSLTNVASQWSLCPIADDTLSSDAQDQKAITGRSTSSQQSESHNGIKTSTATQLSPVSKNDMHSILISPSSMISFPSLTSFPMSSETNLLMHNPLSHKKSHSYKKKHHKHTNSKFNLENDSQSSSDSYSSSSNDSSDSSSSNSEDEQNGNNGKQGKKRKGMDEHVRKGIELQTAAEMEAEEKRKAEQRMADVDSRLSHLNDIVPKSIWFRIIVGTILLVASSSAYFIVGIILFGRFETITAGIVLNGYRAVVLVQMSGFASMMFSSATYPLIDPGLTREFSEFTSPALKSNRFCESRNSLRDTINKLAQHFNEINAIVTSGTKDSPSTGDELINLFAIQRMQGSDKELDSLASGTCDCISEKGINISCPADRLPGIIGTYHGVQELCSRFIDAASSLTQMSESSFSYYDVNYQHMIKSVTADLKNGINLMTNHYTLMLDQFVSSSSRVLLILFITIAVFMIVIACGFYLSLPSSISKVAELSESLSDISSTSSLFVQWKEEMNIGIEQWDTLHRNIIESIGSLLADMKENTARSKLSREMESILALFGEHCAIEEALMEYFNLPSKARNQHFVVHVWIYRKMVELYQKFQNEKPHASEVNLLYQSIVKDEMDATDRELSTFIQASGTNIPSDIYMNKKGANVPRYVNDFYNGQNATIIEKHNFEQVISRLNKLN